VLYYFGFRIYCLLMNKSLLAGATLVGTIIGAGVFAIPYVFSQSGILPCLIYFLILGPVLILLHLFFGEIILRTNEEQRLVGYTQKYLGRKARFLVALSIFVGILGSLLVYLILAGDFLGLVLPDYFSPAQYSILLWGLLTFLVFLGTRSVALVELIMAAAFLFVVSIILLFCLPHFHLANLVSVNLHRIFLPFGIFFFSLVGWSAIGETEDILTDKKKLKTVIIGSLSFCVLFYFLFGLIISGVSGSGTTAEALKGLVPILGSKVMIFGALFGILVVATSFLTIANYLKNTFIFDYKMPYWLAFGLACFAPLLLFLLGLRDFIAIISVLGSVIGVIEGSALVLIYNKSRRLGNRQPEYSLKIPLFLLYLIIFVLLAGAIAQIFYS